MWQKLNKNKAEDFDVFAVNTAELQRYIQGGLVAPVQVTNIPNIAKQLPRFRDLNGITGLVHGNKVYAIPYTYSEMGLIFDKQQVKQTPTSLRVLWEPRYPGNVLMYNGATHNFSLTAQATHVRARRVTLNREEVSRDLQILASNPMTFMVLRSATRSAP